MPSRAEEPPTGLATVILVATDWPADLERALAGLRAHGPDGLQIVVVADGPSPEQDAALEALEADDTEVVRTSERLGPGGGDQHRHPAGGGGGRRRPRHQRRADRRRRDAARRGARRPDGRGRRRLGHRQRRPAAVREAPAGDVDAIEGYAIAFRRDDAIARGPLDERFRFYRNLDIWWSLVLRDEGEERPAATRRRGRAAGRPATSTAAGRASRTRSGIG